MNDPHVVELLIQIRNRLTWIAIILAGIGGIVWRASGEWPF